MMAAAFAAGHDAYILAFIRGGSFLYGAIVFDVAVRVYCLNDQRKDKQCNSYWRTG